MKISKEARRFARELFTLSLTNGRLDAGKSKSLTDQLVAEKPRGYAQIIREYARLARLELERRHATIDSAVSLDGAQTEKLRQDIVSRFGDDVTIEFRTNPALLGGLRIQVGSDVWDGTVSNRLHLLSQQL
ncbi:MAG TPA: F0F1 ATP synthase subunit delta [Chthoniobacterales bacterium]|jgi:F-type H+-transporting ATPase subunit delta|nr:F0F1 ATP synthase subunit delta [Chthoniobacterales bacterium]